MTLKTDIRAATSHELFPRRGMQVKVVMWCGKWALCEAEMKEKPKRIWINKSKLK